MTHRTSPIAAVTPRPRRRAADNAPPPPIEIGPLIDAAHAAREALAAVAARQREEIEPTRVEAARLEAELSARLGQLGLTSARGTRATASIVETTHYTVDDWEAVYAYIKRRGRWDLLQQRLAQRATAATYEAVPAGVPGTHAERQRTLRLTTLRPR